MLVEHTERMLYSWRTLRPSSTRNVIASSGRLRWRRFPPLPAVSHHALLSLRRTCPQLRVVLTEQEPPESVPLLVRGDVDLVIAQDWANAPLSQLEGLSKTPLLDDIADIALPTSHPMAGRKIIDLDDLRSDQWITWGHNGSILSDTHCPPVGAVSGSCTHFDRAVMTLWLPTPLANTQHNSRSSRPDLALV